MAFLSPGYLADLGARLALARANEEGPRVGIGQLVTGAPDGDVVYTVLLGGGEACELVPGSLEGATVTLVIDYETAQRLAGGAEITAALDEGRIKVRGDVDALVRAYPVVQDALAGLDQA